MRRVASSLRANISYNHASNVIYTRRPFLSIANTRLRFFTRQRHHPLVQNPSQSVYSYKTRSSPSNMALTRSTDPLVWIDCEMTGLDTTKDQILSISCFITSADLTLLDDKGYHAIIATPKAVLDAMGDWCQRTHTATGLVAACQSPTAVSAEQAASELLDYIKRHVPKPRTALLAGNSVHADKMFLVLAPWTAVIEYLHYRILDVSAIKEGVRRWCGEEVLRQVPVKKGVHSAEDDIRESLAEARYYMGMFSSFAKGTRSD